MLQAANTDFYNPSAPIALNSEWVSVKIYYFLSELSQKKSV